VGEYEVKRGEINLQGGERRSLFEVSLDENDFNRGVAKFVNLLLRKIGPYTGSFSLFIERKGDIRSFIPFGNKHSILIKEPGTFQVVLENTEKFSQSFLFKGMIYNSIRMKTGELYKIESLSPNVTLLTDGKRLLVKKSLRSYWDILQVENFEGLRTWILLNTFCGEFAEHCEIPKLYQLNLQKKNIIIEYIQGRTLKEEMHSFKKNPERNFEKIMRVFIQTAETLRKVSVSYSTLILHRDIKPTNIIVSDKGTHIIDWELSCLLENCKMPVGQNPYASPESASGNYSEKSDVYSLGATMAEAFGILVRGGRETSTKKGREYLLAPVSKKSELYNLISSMLEISPEKRPSYDEVIETLKKILNEG
jgi:serine/threonine protein kinase